MSACGVQIKGHRCAGRKLKCLLCSVLIPRRQDGCPSFTSAARRLCLGILGWSWMPHLQQVSVVVTVASLSPWTSFAVVFWPRASTKHSSPVSHRSLDVFAISRQSDRFLTSSVAEVIRPAPLAPRCIQSHSSLFLSKAKSLNLSMLALNVTLPKCFEWLPVIKKCPIPIFFSLRKI